MCRKSNRSFYRILLREKRNLTVISRTCKFYHWSPPLKYNGTMTVLLLLLLLLFF